MATGNRYGWLQTEFPIELANDPFGDEVYETMVQGLIDYAREFQDAELLPGPPKLVEMNFHNHDCHLLEFPILRNLSTEARWINEGY